MRGPGSRCWSATRSVRCSGAARFRNLDDALGGIEELRRHSDTRERYRASHAPDGDCFFEFLDPAGEPMALSRPFASYKLLLSGEAFLPMLRQASLTIGEAERQAANEATA